MQLIGVRPLTIITVIIAACYLIFTAYAYSFRVDDLSLIPNLNINTHRWLLALLGGVAFGVSSAATLNQDTLINHVRYYSVLMVMVLSYFMVKWWLDTTMLALMAGALSAFVWNFLCERILRSESLQNIAMIVLLIVSFFLSVIVFGFASMEVEPALTFWHWLFGSLNLVSDLASVQLVIIALLVGAMSAIICLRDKQLAMAFLLFGMALGVLGAVFFVGAVAASIAARIADKLKLTKPSNYLISGLLAAAFVVSADSLPRLLVGGYSPFLLITTVILMMPLVVFLQLIQTRVTSKNQILIAIEWLLFVLMGSTSVAIIWHLNQFAQGLI
jgi:hypothetical protein